MLSEKGQSGKGGEGVDWRVSDVEALKKAYWKWRKVSTQAMLPGVLIIILFWAIHGIPFFWRFVFVLLGLTPFVVFYLTYAFKIVRDWGEVGVVFRKGVIDYEAYPGWHFLRPPTENMRFVRTYDENFDPPDQEIFTSETIGGEQKPMPAFVDIVFWGRVNEPVKFIRRAENVKESALKLVMGILRSICSKMSFDKINTEKNELAGQVEADVNKELKDWGYEIFKLQIQSIKASQKVLEQQEAIVARNKAREANLIDAGTRAQVMAVLDKADPDMRRRELQALETFKGSINLIGSSIEEILTKITGSAKK